MKTKSEYKIGYRKPPQGTRFKKGHCPANKGKKFKRETSIETMLAEELKERVPFTQNGSHKTVMKLRLMIKQAVNKAIGGNFKPLMTLNDMRQVLNHLNNVPTGKRRSPLSDLDNLDGLSAAELVDLYRKAVSESW